MKDEHSENVYNLTKIFAEELLSTVMEKVGLAETQQNCDDTLALALNYLPSKYVTTDEGKQYAKLLEVYRVQYESDVVTALTKACIKVKEKPRTADGKEADR